MCLTFDFFHSCFFPGRTEPDIAITVLMVSGTVHDIVTSRNFADTHKVSFWQRIFMAFYKIVVTTEQDKRVHMAPK